MRSRSRPPGSRSGWPKSTTQVSRPSSCSAPTAEARGETSHTSVVSISGGMSRIGAAVAERRRRSSAAAGSCGARPRPRTATAPRRSPARRTAPPRRRCAPSWSAAPRGRGAGRRRRRLDLGVLFTHEDELSLSARALATRSAHRQCVELRARQLDRRDRAQRRPATGARRRATSRSPIAAIIAPLSVHSRDRRHPQLDPGGVAALLRPARAAASSPRPRRTMTSVLDALLARQARTALVVSTSATASWKRRRDVGRRHSHAGASPRLDAARHRRLQPGEREAERGSSSRPSADAGTRPRAGSPVARRPVDRRAARVRQPEQPGHLVERLAGRVVERVATGARSASGPRSRTSSSDVCPPETMQRRRDRSGSGPCSSGVGRGVPGQVVDAVERHAQRERVRLRGRDADDAARRPGPGRR